MKNKKMENDDFKFEVELLKELETIQMPAFKEEKDKQEYKEEDNTRIYISKLFKDFEEVYEYISDIILDIKKNIPKYNAKLFKISTLNELKKLNNSYHKYYDDMFKKLDKIEAFLFLRKALNITDQNILKNNSIIYEDVRKIKKTLFKFSKKILKKKEKNICIKEKEEKKKKGKYTRHKKNNILRKEDEFSKNILKLKNNEIEKIGKVGDNKKFIDDNLTLLLEIYCIYSSIYTKEEMFENIIGKSDILNNDVFFKKAKEILSNDNILRYNELKKKVIRKKKHIKKELEKEKECNVLDIQMSNDIILKTLNILGKDYVKTLASVFENNQIDYFKNEKKQSGNVTIGKYNGYIILENEEGKDIDIYAYIHELGHLVRYVQDTYSNYHVIEEMYATLNEALLFKYINKVNDERNEKEKKKVISKKYMLLICDGILYFLDKIFNTLECYVFQNDIFDKIIELKEEITGKNSKKEIDKICDEKMKALKAFALKRRKDNLKMLQKENIDKKVYSFLCNKNFLNPYYSITYFLSVILSFNILNDKKTISMEEKDIDSVIEKYEMSIVELFNVCNILEYFEDIIKNNLI